MLEQPGDSGDKVAALLSPEGRECKSQADSSGLEPPGLGHAPCSLSAKRRQASFKGGEENASCHVQRSLAHKEQ